MFLDTEDHIFFWLYEGQFDMKIVHYFTQIIKHLL